VTSVTLSKPDKVLWPLAGFTKAALAEYYLAVAPALLPHLAERPVTLRRFPDGVDAPGWYQTNCRGPEWLPTSLVPGRRGEVFRMCRLEEPRALAWAAQVGALELHPLLAMADALDRPTALVLDLDPGPPADVLDCCAVALALRDELDALGLASFPKTSGSVGLHVYVPLNTGVSYADTKALARTLAERLARVLPERVVATQKRSLRAGRVLVDWLQNEPMRSTVAPYSLRALPFPTVSMPVTWDEVDRAAAAGRPELLTFLPADALSRLDRLGDLFRPVLELEQRLPTAP
jgi:bifunctional non-homologous end joining protein LigD